MKEERLSAWRGPDGLLGARPMKTLIDQEEAKITAADSHVGGHVWKHWPSQGQVPQKQR